MLLVSGKNVNSYANFYSNRGNNARSHRKHALYKHHVGGEGGVAIWSSCRSQSHTSEALTRKNMAAQEYDVRKCFHF